MTRWWILAFQGSQTSGTAAGKHVLELPEESLRWEPSTSRCHEDERGEQRAASRCAVELDLDRVATALRGRSTKPRRLLFQVYSSKIDARLVVLMMVVLSVSKK